MQNSISLEISVFGYFQFQTWYVKQTKKDVWGGKDVSLQPTNSGFDMEWSITDFYLFIFGLI